MPRLSWYFDFFLVPYRPDRLRTPFRKCRGTCPILKCGRMRRIQPYRVVKALRTPRKAPWVSRPAKKGSVSQHMLSAALELRPPGGLGIAMRASLELKPHARISSQNLGTLSDPLKTSSIAAIPWPIQTRRQQESSPKASKKHEKH